MMDKMSLRHYHLIAITFFLVIAVLCNYQPSAMLISQVPFDYNEGWNALYSKRLNQGESLYPHYDALISNNYPPLSFYLNTCLSAIVGDDLITGRIISLISLFSVASILGLCIIEMGGRGTEAVVMSSFFWLPLPSFPGATLAWRIHNGSAIRRNYQGYTC